MNEDKADPIQQLTAIPWWQSKVLQGIIVSGASQIVASLQSHGVVKITPDVDFWVELAFQAIAIIAAAYAFIARTHKPTPPVSLSKASAAATNAASPIPEIANANIPPSESPPAAAPTSPTG
jgi:hypothetical protein